MNSWRDFLNAYLAGLLQSRRPTRITASTRSRTRATILRSASSQKRKSWQNSGWKIASRSARTGNAHLPAQLVNRFGLAASASGPIQGREQPLRIFRRPQKVSRFHQACQLIGWNHGYLLFALAPDNHDLAITHDPVEHGGETLTQLSVGCFSHANDCTGIMYIRQSSH